MFDFEISRGIIKQGDFFYKNGNLVDAFYSGNVDHIIHGANCFCTMGSGLALTVKDRLPELYEADLQTNKGDISKLGTFSYHDYGNRFGFNAYIQYNYGRNGLYMDYDALESSLLSVNRFLEERCGVDNPQTIGLPMIGCGLAGGDWDRVANVIRNTLNSHCVYVYQL